MQKSWSIPTKKEKQTNIYIGIVEICIGIQPNNC